MIKGAKPISERLSCLGYHNYNLMRRLKKVIIATIRTPSDEAMVPAEWAARPSGGLKIANAFGRDARPPLSKHVAKMRNVCMYNYACF